MQPLGATTKGNAVCETLLGQLPPNGERRPQAETMRTFVSKITQKSQKTLQSHKKKPE